RLAVKNPDRLNTKASLINLIKLPSDLSQASSTAGKSKFTKSPRKPRVFQAPKAIPTAIQIPPAIFAGVLRFSQSKRQITKPRIGGTRLDNFFSRSRT